MFLLYGVHPKHIQALVSVGIVKAARLRLSPDDQNLTGERLVNAIEPLIVEELRKSQVLLERIPDAAERAQFLASLTQEPLRTALREHLKQILNEHASSQVLKNSYLASLGALVIVRLSDVYLTAYNIFLNPLNSQGLDFEANNAFFVKEAMRHGLWVDLTAGTIIVLLQVIALIALRPYLMWTFSKIFRVNASFKNNINWVYGAFVRGIAIVMAFPAIVNIAFLTMNYIPWLADLVRPLTPYFMDMHYAFPVMLSGFLASILLPPYPSFVMSSRLFVAARGWTVKKGLSALWKWIRNGRLGIVTLLVTSGLVLAGLMQHPLAQKAIESGCFASNPLVPKVYALGEEGDGNTCIIGLRAPRHGLHLLQEVPANIRERGMRSAAQIFFQSLLRPDQTQGGGGTQARQKKQEELRPTPKPTMPPKKAGAKGNRIGRYTVRGVLGSLFYALGDLLCTKKEECRDRYHTLMERMFVDPLIARARYEKREQYIENDRDYSLYEIAMENRYGIVFYSDDGVRIKDEELRALIPILEQLPESLQTGADMQGNEDPYLFLFHVPRGEGHEEEAFMWTGGQFGEIIVNQIITCETRYGLTCGSFQDLYIHEILHNHDEGKISSPFCIDRNPCEILDAFSSAADKDGVGFVDGLVQILRAADKGDSQRYVDAGYPRQEMHAYLGSRYVTDPAFMQEYYPNLYNFYRDSVYEGLEYGSAVNEDGDTVIVVK